MFYSLIWDFWNGSAAPVAAYIRSDWRGRH
jgi:hypothetical protein